MNKVVLSAFAADMPAKASKVAVVAPAPSPWDIAFGAAVMNDYIFRGVTQSAHKPSLSAYIEPRYNVSPNLQLYVGTSVETIKFPNDATVELDLYGGFRPTFGALALDFGFWYYGYPNGNCYNTALQGCSRNATLANGNVIKGNLSFWEVYGKATYTAGDWAFGPTFYYTPSFLNSGAPGEYLSLIVKYTAPAAMAINKEIGWYVSGEFGRQWLGTSDSFYSLANTPTSPGINYADYNTWNLGVGFTWKTLTLDLRYSDTDLNKGNCNAFTSDPGASGTTNITSINGGLGSNWCGARFIAKLSIDMTLANLR
jgi:uncharacterized protein (TIGR02001 family)